MSDEWNTPRYIFDALGVEFDLDVAAPLTGPRYVPAMSYFCRDSLSRAWKGFVWMNPPYLHQSGKRRWLEKFSKHGNGIALMPDRTSAPWFQEYAPRMDMILFVSPKIKFERPDGSTGLSPGNGSALFAKGHNAVDALKRATRLGFAVGAAT